MVEYGVFVLIGFAAVSVCGLIALAISLFLKMLANWAG
jgi:hypothetical protein